MTGDRQEFDEELARLTGSGGIRSGAREDAVDGVLPQIVVEPDTAEALAAVLAHCSLHGRTVVFRGGGSRLAWGRTAAAIDVVVGTRRLTRILRYEPGDLTVSVEAGVTFTDLNRELAKHGQMLPVDAPSDTSTIGGGIATNDSGPLRHRYGSIRDQLIGIRLATTDGRLASAGGNVVKNVAGYDLGKLVSGSFGALAGIVSATFKLAPIPVAAETLSATLPDAQALGNAAQSLAASQLDAMCLETQVDIGAPPDAAPTYRLLVRFGGPSAVNAIQVAGAEDLVRVARPASTARMAGEEDREYWVTRGRATWEGNATIVRAAWLPSTLSGVVAHATEIARANRIDVRLSARAAMGSGVLHLNGSASDVAAAIGAMRARGDLWSHVVVMRAPSDVKTTVDVWGAPGGTGPILAAIKRTMDPAGVLNAMRGPV